MNGPEILHAGQGEHKTVSFFAISFNSFLVRVSLSASTCEAETLRCGAAGADEVLQIARVSACNFATDSCVSRRAWEIGSFGVSQP